MKAKPTAYVLKTDGSRVDAKPADGKNFTLEEMQKIVGGYIEMPKIRVNGKAATMVCNEDAIAQGLPINHAATDLAQGFVLMSGGIRGDVLIN